MTNKKKDIQQNNEQIVFEDSLKIREDALKLKERDFLDTLKSIEMENQKTIAVIGFEGVLVSVSFSVLSKMSFWMYAFYLLTILATVVVSFINLFAKKIAIHTDVSQVFESKTNFKDWYKYIESRYEKIRQDYTNAHNLLKIKVKFTNASLILLGLTIFIVLIGGRYGIR